MDTINFLREKKLLSEDKESFKIIHDDAGEVSLNELMNEYAELVNKEKEDSFLRLSADFENYKKRVTKEKNDLVSNTKVSMLSSVLDIDNDISIAIKNVKSKEAIDGLSLILKKVDNFLTKHDIEVIQTEKYDIDLHEVVSVLESNEDKIIDVISKGYSIGGKPFRYPKIILGKSNVEK